MKLFGRCLIYKHHSILIYMVPFHSINIFLVNKYIFIQQTLFCISNTKSYGISISTFLYIYITIYILYTYCGNLRCVGLLGNSQACLATSSASLACFATSQACLGKVLGMPWQGPRHACNVLGLLGMLPARSQESHIEDKTPHLLPYKL